MDYLLHYEEKYCALQCGLNQVIASEEIGPSYIGESKKMRAQISCVISEVSKLVGDVGLLNADIQANEAYYGSQDVQAQTGLHTLRAVQAGKQTLLSEKVASLNRDLTNFVSHVKNAIDKVKTLSYQLYALFNEWKDEQRLAGNGFQIGHNFDRICALGQTYNLCLDQLNGELEDKDKIEQCLSQCEVHNTGEVAQIWKEFRDELHQLWMESKLRMFEVTKQPPQILRLGSTLKQPIDLRLVFGSGVAHSKGTLEVEAILLDEPEVTAGTWKEEFWQQPHIPKSCTKLDHGKARVIEGINGIFSVTLSDIEIPEKRKKVNEKRCSASAKYCFAFCATLTLPGCEPMRIWTISVPFALTIHPNQDANGWATILWYNAFASPNRTAFQVILEVDVYYFLQVLSNIFLMKTGRGFSDSQKKFLKSKLMGQSNGPLTWDMFAKNKLDCSMSTKKRTNSGEKEKITFNVWLFKIMTMLSSTTDQENEPPSPTGSHSSSDSGTSKRKKPRKSPSRGGASMHEKNAIAHYWREGRFEGFVTKEDLHAALRVESPGTFVLYFSEAICGGITVSWYNNRVNDINKFVPYMKSDLDETSLEERLLSAPHLHFLYPKIPKEQVFHVDKKPPGLYDYVRHLVGYLREANW